MVAIRYAATAVRLSGEIQAGFLYAALVTRLAGCLGWKKSCRRGAGG
jgi:hypothetical protein